MQIGHRHTAPLRGRRWAVPHTISACRRGPWTLAALLGAVALLASVGTAQQQAHTKNARAITAEDFAAAGLGPLGRDQPAAALYLDLIKRTLINVIYYESSQALWVYGPDHAFRRSDGFELQSRVVGEDMPGNAMSMIGLKRMDNLQQVRDATTAWYQWHCSHPTVSLCWSFALLLCCCCC